MSDTNIIFLGNIVVIFIIIFYVVSVIRRIKYSYYPSNDNELAHIYKKIKNGKRPFLIFYHLSSRIRTDGVFMTTYVHRHLHQNYIIKEKGLEFEMKTIREFNKVLYLSKVISINGRSISKLSFEEFKDVLKYTDTDNNNKLRLDDIGYEHTRLFIVICYLIILVILMGIFNIYDIRFH